MDWSKLLSSFCCDMNKTYNKVFNADSPKRHLFRERKTIATSACRLYSVWRLSVLFQDFAMVPTLQS